MHDKPFLLHPLERWAASIGALAIILGGVVWLTTLFNLSADNQQKIQDLRVEFNQADGHASTRLSSIEDRLARIETKVDLLLEALRRR